MFLRMVDKYKHRLMVGMRSKKHLPVPWQEVTNYQTCGTDDLQAGEW